MRAEAIGATVALGALVCSLLMAFFVRAQAAQREADKLEAAKAMVAWVIEDKAIPGFSEDCPDFDFVRRKKRVFVICDFAPLETPLSTDPRVERILPEVYQTIFDKYDYDDTAYIRVRLISEKNDILTFDFSYMFGSLGGHGFTFFFRRDQHGNLVATGRYEWIS